MASLKERWSLAALLGRAENFWAKANAMPLYNNNNLMDEMSNFRDKYLKE